MSPDARREDYWNEIENSQRTVGDLIREKVEADGWSPHAIVRAGESESTDYLIVICSQARDAGLILREGYVTVPDDAEDADAVKWGQCHDRRVSGPLAQGLVRGYARASNDDLASDANADPLLIDAIGEEIEDDPDVLAEPIGDHPDADRSSDHDRGRSAAAQSGSSETVECQLTGEQVPKSEAINLGDALGTDHWVSKAAKNGETDE